MPLDVADVNVAVLVIFAVASMGVYGIVLAGWSSNSKYSLLGGLRVVGADDQLRVELRHGAGRGARARQLAVAAVTVNAQAGYWHLFGFQLRRAGSCSSSRSGFFIFMTAGIAETNRAPFDFPEAEQELVAGYHTEYSSMSFALFFLAEYVNMVTVSAVATNLYLGGWHLQPLPRVARHHLVVRASSRCCCSSTCGCAGRCRATGTTS